MSEQDKIREMLSAYLDGELDFTHAKQVQRAIEEDPALAAELAKLTAVRDLLRHLPQKNAPDGFAAGVLERAERSQLVAPSGPAPEPKRHSLSRYSAIAAIVLVGAGIGLVIYNFLWSSPAPHAGRPGSDELAQVTEPHSSQTRTVSQALDEHLSYAGGTQNSSAMEKSIEVKAPQVAASAPTEQPAADAANQNDTPLFIPPAEGNSLAAGLESAAPPAAEPRLQAATSPTSQAVAATQPTSQPASAPASRPQTSSAPATPRISE